MHTEFEATNGSEVHIYTSYPLNTYQDCDDFNSFLRPVNSSSTANENINHINAKEIELQFA